MRRISNKPPLDRLSLMFRNTQRAKLGEERFQRVMELLKNDIAEGVDLSTKDRVYRAFHGKVKYLRIVDESARKRDIRLRSLWLLLESGRRFRIGKHAVSVCGGMGWIDGRTGTLNDYFRSWVEKRYREAGKIEALDEEGQAELDRFPILKEES